MRNAGPHNTAELWARSAILQIIANGVLRFGTG